MLEAAGLLFCAHDAVAATVAAIEGAGIYNIVDELVPSGCQR